MSAFRATLAALVLLALPAHAHDGVHVEDAYARASVQSGAVFMTIINHSAEPDRLIAARTDAAARAELHTHTEDANGVMQMLEVPEGFPIAGGETHALSRGGDHVMLMGLTKPLRNGDTITLTLTFEREGEVTLDVPVDNDRKDAGGHDHSGHGKKHGMGDGQSGQLTQGTGHDHAAAPDTTGLSDPEAVTALLKAQFETPESPLTVDPIVIEGDHALASWAQGDKGGRALLRRQHGAWQVVLCGGPDLRMPAFLAQHGVPAAERLSSLYNAAEDSLGADKVALSSSFEGVVMVGDH